MESVLQRFNCISFLFKPAWFFKLNNDNAAYFY